MSTAVARAVLGMARSLERLAGFEGTYSRANGEEVTAKGTVVLREYEVLDDDGTVTRVKSFDWLFCISDLSGVLPKSGDRFYVADFTEYGVPGQFDANFEAMPIGKRPCFEPHDSQGEVIVVHMKKIETSDA